MKRNNNFREMISGSNGIISSKRVMGVVVLTVCMICTCWLVWSEGGTTVVENLLQTLMIMAAALLGISSVTSIWKKGHHVDTAKTIEGFNVDKEETTTSEPQQFNPDDPCANCIHNKKDQS
jgi:hypothetical protein